MKENMWLAATLYPAALVWYGWSAERHLPWIVACIANFFFGFGSMLVFGAVTTMLTEFMPSAQLVRGRHQQFRPQYLLVHGSIVAQPLINALGNGWTCTMLGAHLLGDDKPRRLRTQDMGPYLAREHG